VLVIERSGAPSTKKLCPTSSFVHGYFGRRLLGWRAAGIA
jgi:hypothetical protein